jgi:GNAT superfamily N-acetyltransferase
MATITVRWATPEQPAGRMLACQSVLASFIGELDGQLVGFACLRLVPHLQRDEPYAELTDIYVDAPFRRHGVAHALVAQVEAAARAASASEIVIITGFDVEGAQAAYRASGYADWALRCGSASRANNEPGPAVAASLIAVGTGRDAPVPPSPHRYAPPDARFHPL